MRFWFRRPPQATARQERDEWLAWLELGGARPAKTERRTRHGRPGEEEIQLRLLSRISIGGEPTWNGTSCWSWTHGRYDNGYARICYRGKTQLAHRLSYELFRGIIPDGLQLDHLCENRGCINPDHLEPVTARTNTMRSGTAVAAKNARRTHCKRGHEFTSENTYVESSGRRACRTCNSAWRRAKRAGLSIEEVLAGDLRQRKPKWNARRPSPVSNEISARS